MEAKLIAALAGVIVILALAGAVLFEHSRVVSAQAQAKALATAHATDIATIASIQANVAANDAAITALQSQLSDIRTTEATAQTNIAALKRSNAEVKAYLDASVPADVLGVLNRRPNTAHQ